MEQPGMGKKIAAALAAVEQYLQEEQAAAVQAMMPPAAAVPASPMRLWGFSGRQAQMANRQLMQMRTFR